jgi:hypothetical protein
MSVVSFDCEAIYPRRAALKVSAIKIRWIAPKNLKKLKFYNTLPPARVFSPLLDTRLQ